MKLKCPEGVYTCENCPYLGDKCEGGFQMKQLTKLDMIKIFMSFSGQERKVITKYVKKVEEETKKLNKVD